MGSRVSKDSGKENDNAEMVVPETLNIDNSNSSIVENVRGGLHIL